MTATGQEIEVKFYVPDLPAMEQRLKELGASLSQPRLHETNLRFDTPGRDLSRAYRVLRLRRDAAARVTYKGPGTVVGGARLRQELEFTVDDFESAQAFFEALGYEVMVMYEKYRTVYALGQVLVTLDEMPYGPFIEIEGPDAGSIRQAASQLGLAWEQRILDSYLMIFDRVKAALGLRMRDLSFDSFAGIDVPSSLFSFPPPGQ